MGSFGARKAKGLQMQPFGRCEAISVALVGDVSQLSDDGHGGQRQSNDEQFHLFPFLC
ncbi:hypothetical protein ACS5PN_03970 [Roseateles sp. NT4]|uniref:hypothetical protein n=1 Tax=Roseateles sp. NT4 TaxID=3453715 RepID=UPI003EE9E3D5